MSMPGPLELAIIFLVVLLVVGPKRIAGVARGLGQGIKEFKDTITQVTKKN